ncbi:MAG TPA: DUF2063 domain-containing protein, partial [Chromatiales bacterium]|nr:DUF2063 domain-containing protein [Chromatiales bacterium]
NTPLAHRQTALQSFLLHADPSIIEHVVGDEKADAKQRLDVYFQAYRLRLQEVLATDFEGLHALLGDEGFEQMSLAYIDAYPSQHPSVRWFGRALAGFLAGQYPDRPELAEMAAFEWAWGQAFDAADAPVADDSALAGLDASQWPALTVTLHPSVQQLSLHFNIPAVFAAAVDDKSLPELVHADTAVNWLLWRHELNVHWRSLAGDEFWAMQAAGQGVDFASLCEGLCEWHEPAEVPLRAASLLKTWLGEGLISEVHAG